MTCRKKWAIEYTKNWTHDKPGLTEAELDALAGAYEAGFEAALNRAGKLLDFVPHTNETGISLLIRAIGKRQIDQMDEL